MCFCIDYAESFDFLRDKIHIADSVTSTETSLLYDQILMINNDALPTNNPSLRNANSRVSGRGTIAHEVFGRYETVLRGTAFDQFDQIDGQMIRNVRTTALDEAQASIRAARFAPGLSDVERIILTRDGLQRLKNADIRLRDVRHLLDILDR